MASYAVFLNYPFRYNHNDNGTVIDFRNDFFHSFRSKQEAIKFTRTKRLKSNETIYIIERNSNSEKSVYYKTNSIENDIQ